MNIPQAARDRFFAYARARQEIHEARLQGKPYPWTTDPILHSYSFCNIFREDDRTTVWFRQNIRERLRNDPRILFATIVFRWFNKIETGQALRSLLLTSWNRDIAERKLRKLWTEGPIITGAYIINTPPAMDKVNGLLWCIDNVRDVLQHTPARKVMKQHPTLQSLHGWLRQFPRMGEFMAYEVVTDMRHTQFYEGATDILTWANPGPGCARGLGWLVANDPDYFSLGSRAHRELMLQLMHILLEESRLPQAWPWLTQAWEMREVEHTLCEFDKYQRTLKGFGRPKAIYRRRDDDAYHQR